jgi:uncharacterized protein with HEPN domain
LTDEDRDWFHLRQILRLIAHIDRRLDDIEERAFAADEDEVDLTAYRLQMIGESARKLSDELKARNPKIDWQQMVSMRNMLAHTYEGRDVNRLWRAAREHLDDLAEVCRGELGDDQLP